jgi:hypothetical protein
MENNIYEGNNIQGWMTPEELQFLYMTAKGVNSVLEIGSWRGRSTHALLSGCKGRVTAVDHFKGSAQSGDATNWLAKESDIYKEFMDNVGNFSNLRVIKASSKGAREILKEEVFDMIFIDGEHSYEAVKEDIALWKDKAKVILCGHDYCSAWIPVQQAVDESIVKDGVVGSIWFKKTPDDSIIDLFTDKIKKKENFSFIKRGDGEEFCMSGMVGTNCDGHEYSPELGKELKDSFDFFATQENCFVPLFDDQNYFNVLLHRIGKNNAKVKGFYQAIREDERKKFFVGPKRLARVARILKAKHIIIPEKNAFNEYVDIVAKIMEEMIPNKQIFSNNIVLFSAGMPAKVLIREVLTVIGMDNTCLDLGSAFDSLISQTRTNQLSKGEMLELYADWIME